jgi:hypothetical protein
MESIGVATGVTVVLLAPQSVVGREVRPYAAGNWDFWAGVSLDQSSG